MAVRYEGVVRWFDNVKGFGFVGTEGEPDVFVHYTGIAADGYRTLTAGLRVSYRVENFHRGPQAVDVVRLDGIQYPDVGQGAVARTYMLSSK